MGLRSPRAISDNMARVRFAPISKPIPEKVYRTIHRFLPVVCVDLVVTDKRRTGFLLVKRANDPEKGRWWFPGGRLLKNEKLLHAVKRKLREETGLRGTAKKILGVHEYFSERGYFPGTNVHTIPIVFLVEVSRSGSVTVNEQSSSAGWFTKIGHRWDPYVKEYLRWVGFR